MLLDQFAAMDVNAILPAHGGHWRSAQVSHEGWRC
jgi:hypothetical protein